MANTNIEKLLEQITELSHQFGTKQYVCGGGGNTSVKNQTTLWVKPSGTTLINIKAGDFVAIDRAKLAKLYQLRPPENSSGREVLVKDVMAGAVISKKASRASVEAPLHDSLAASFVVHTHPAIVNGLTCSKDGKAVCKELFPDALWLDYIDPGYTLCMEVRRQIKQYKSEFAREPEIIFLKNHGLFVAADSPEQIKALYKKIIDTLCSRYDAAGISQVLEIMEPNENIDIDLLKTVFDGFEFAFSGYFDYADSPISPDHIVYSKSYPFIGKPAKKAIDDFKTKHGYAPNIVVWGNSVIAIGQTKKKAQLALELFKDGALIKKLAQAFGGICYMTDVAREFIENWEVESYRSKQL